MFLINLVDTDNNVDALLDTREVSDQSTLDPQPFVHSDVRASHAGVAGCAVGCAPQCAVEQRRIDRRNTKTLSDAWILNCLKVSHEHMGRFRGQLFPTAGSIGQHQ